MEIKKNKKKMNNKNHQIHVIPQQNHENHENLIVPIQNNENPEIQKFCLP